MVQCRQHAHAPISRGQRVTNGNPHAAWRAVGFANNIAPAAHGLANTAKPCSVRIGSCLAIAGHACNDEAGVFRQEGVWRKTPFFHCAGFEILDQNVCFADQLADKRLSFGDTQIGRNRFFVARYDFPLHLFCALAPYTHGVTGTRWFHLDDLSAHIAKQLSAKRTSKQLAEFNNAQPL